MDSDTLRYEILRVLGEHESSPQGGRYFDDAELAERLRVSLSEVQRQLTILSSHDLVTLAEGFGPKYGALITPAGLEALEEATRQDFPEGRRIGF
jgi:DNA-binding transcriptional ArsR family regulator